MGCKVYQHVERRVCEKLSALVKCPKCGYEWDSKSIKMWICCPNCLRKTKNNTTKIAINLEAMMLVPSDKEMYDDYVKGMRESPSIDEDTGLPDKIMSYNEWRKQTGNK